MLIVLLISYVDKFQSSFNALLKDFKRKLCIQEQILAVFKFIPACSYLELSASNDNESHIYLELNSLLSAVLPEPHGILQRVEFALVDVRDD